MQNLTPDNNLLTMQIGLTATPVISFTKINTGVQFPTAVSTGSSGGFSLSFDVAVQYASLTVVLNGLLAGKSISISEGLFANHIIIKEIILQGYKQEEILISCHFTGSFKGTIYFTGKPVYNAILQSIDVQALQYNLQTKNLLLKGAKWLLAGKIEKELKKAASISLNSYFAKAKTSLESFLNREWKTGIAGAGNIDDLQLVSISALPEHLVVRALCKGGLQINIQGNVLPFLG